MTVTKEKNGSSLILAIEGSVDSTNADEFEKQAEEDIEGVTLLTLDFSKLSYISSAGLRVLLLLQKRMNRQGSMKLINVSEAIGDILDVTGFSEILTIE